MKSAPNKPCPCGSGLKFKHCCGRAGNLASRSPVLPEGLFRRALACHQKGQLTEAEALYRQVLEAVPRHAQARHLLGAAHGQRGDIDSAIALIREAIELRPLFPEAYNNLGHFLRAAGELNAAIDAFRTALKIQPAYPEALNNLGSALFAKGEPLHEAMRCYERAIELQPAYAEAHFNLGLAHFANGKAREAIDHYRRALAVQPGFAEPYHDLGLALQVTGQLDEALSAYRKAVTLRPNRAETHNNLGNLFRTLEQPESAIGSYRHALALRPRYPEALCNLAQALNTQGDIAQANTSYREALEIDPASAIAHYGLASLLHEQGQFAEAMAEYAETIRLNPAHAEAYAGLLRCKRVTDEDRKILEKMELLLATPQNLSETDVISLHATLGKAYDDLGDYARAMEHFVAGNRLQGVHAHFDQAQHAAYVARLIGHYSREYLSDQTGSGNGSDLPVFIVGMPRSGTTLVEQVLSSHPKVGAGGELGFWAGQEPILSRDLEAMPDHDAERLAIEAYLTQLGSLAPDALRVTDKLTTNYLRLGLIHRLLPRARIIHCRRHPLDTCLSVFFTRFAGRHDYTYHLEDLASYYLEYQRLMEHWRNTLPAAAFYEVDYEQMVTYFDATSRELLAFCGLEWDDAVLDFASTQRAVRTASKWQVRQPLYSSSVARWRHYEKYLGSLTRLVGDNLV